MRVIPVIDLLGGQVVRGVGGRREEYRPIVSTIVDSAEPGAVAAAFVRQFGAQQVYVADLDVITRFRPDVDSWVAIGAAGCSLLLDAGIVTAKNAEAHWHFLENRIPRSELVIGLETLQSFSELEAMRFNYFIPLSRAVLSLDMRAGLALARDPQLQQLRPDLIVARALKLGIQKFILLDLADVGTGQGTSTLPLLRQLCEQFPDCEFIAGGGVRGPEDLRALQEAGAEGALVASALHDGRLSPADCQAF
jgi:phosphoribosylformimino-5-aminoimidazole carboxamide ribotide isomerase